MITIIVPVYNMEKYLEQCINSILNQSYKNIELILVDDGSKDRSPELCDSYLSDPRVKVIHKKNGGQGSARNMGIDIAKGEYLSFIDSDDWVSQDMYVKLMSAIEKSNADIAICEVSMNYEDGRVVKKKRVNGTLVMSRQEAMGHRFDNSEIITDSPCNKLYKKDLFDNLRYPEDRLLEDSAIMYKLIDRTETVVSIENIGYNIRCVSNSVSRRKYNKRRCDTITTYKEMLEFVSSNDEYRKYVNTVNSYIAGAIFFNTGEMYGVNFDGKKDTIEYIKACAKELLNSNHPLSFKNKLLLSLIKVSPNAFGFIYKISRK